MVWLHGFTQTRESAHQFRTILAGTHELLTLDLPGHGENSSVTASLPETAELLADALPSEPFVLGGYSYGARVALHLALLDPARIHSLVLLGATRGIEDEGERRERRARDEELADRIERVGTDAFLEEWLRMPMFASLPDDPDERAARSRDAHGLASSLRSSGTGTQRWLAPTLARIDCPTLALAGSLDDKFIAEATAIAATVQHGTHRIVSDAHHAAHLERPAQAATVISDFIATR